MPSPAKVILDSGSLSRAVLSNREIIQATSVLEDFPVGVFKKKLRRMGVINFISYFIELNINKI